MKTIKDKFFEKVLKTDGCWIWTGGKKQGTHKYGIFYESKKPKKAHRFSWELHNGKIPEKMCVLHKCDNPTCVNPNHLEIGTQFKNIKDRDIKMRYAKGMNHPSHKLSDKDIPIIRKLYDEKISSRKIGIKFGVCHDSIMKIIYRKTWKHI